MNMRDYTILHFFLKTQIKESDQNYKRNKRPKGVKKSVLLCF